MGSRLMFDSQQRSRRPRAVLLMLDHPGAERALGTSITLAVRLIEPAARQKPGR